MKASAEPQKIFDILKNVDGVYIENQSKFEVFPIERFEKKNAVRCPMGFVFIGSEFVCPQDCCELCRDERSLGCELGAIIPLMRNCSCERYSFDCPNVNRILLQRGVKDRFRKQTVLVLKTES